MSSDSRVSRRPISPPLNSWNLLQSSVDEEDREIWQTLTEFLRNTGHPREANHMLHCRVRLEGEVLTIYTSDQYLTYFGNPRFEHAAEVCCGRKTQVRILVDPVFEQEPRTDHDVSPLEEIVEKPETWMIQPRPESSTRRHIFMRITPVLANSWLEHANIDNRNFSTKWCAQLATDMEHDRWTDNGQTITFNRNGDLINGQHRLGACVRSKTTFMSDVIFGLPPNAVVSTDIGRNRTIGHITKIQGISNANLIGAVGNLICIEETYGGLKFHAFNNCTKAEILETVMKHHDELQRIIALCAHWFKHKLASPRIIVFCYYQFSQPEEVHKLSKRLLQEGLPAVCKRFFDEVLTGVGLQKTSPAYHLHQRLITQAQNPAKYRPEYVIGQFRITWGAYREDRPTKRFKLDLDIQKEFPTLD